MNDLYRISFVADPDGRVLLCLPVSTLVEPVLIITDDWTPVDSLPEGRYAVVKLESNDE